MKVKEESEKVGLKLNIQKTMIMVSGPISSWQIDGETVETVAIFQARVLEWGAIAFSNIITRFPKWDTTCGHNPQKSSYPRLASRSKILGSDLKTIVCMN